MGAELRWALSFAAIAAARVLVPMRSYPLTVADAIFSLLVAASARVRSVEAYQTLFAVQVMLAW